MCTNRSTQIEYVKYDDTASPTASTKPHITTSGIDAKQKINVITANIPNAFVQTDVDKKARGKCILMKIKRAQVGMLAQISPKVYTNYIAI